MSPQTETVVTALARQFPAGTFLTRREELFCYRYDASIDRSWPAAVFIPETGEQLREGLKAIFKANLPITCRGAGTGLSGGAVPAPGAVVVVMTRLRGLTRVDPANRLALVEPGVVNLKLSAAVAAHGLCYAPDPSSQRTCTIGGNVSENAGGPHCLKYGVTAHHILGLHILRPGNGEFLELGGEALDPPGYDLLALMLGSEGTLAPVLAITTRLSPKVPAVRTLLAVFDSIPKACQAVTEIINTGLIPAALEMIDKLTIEAVERVIQAGYPESAEAVLLVELDGLEASLAGQVAKVKRACEGLAVELREATNEKERAQLWRGRKEAIGALGKIAPNYYIQDGVIPRSRLPELLPAINAISARYGVKIANVFHAGDGNLHPVLLFDRKAPGETERVIKAGTEVLRACVEAGGSITGEHGIGLEKRHAFGFLFSEADLALFRALRKVFDPKGLMNPDKVLPTPGACLEGGKGPRHFDANHQLPDPLPLIKLELSPAEQALTDRIKGFNEDAMAWRISGSGNWKPDDRDDRRTVSLPEAFNGIIEHAKEDLSITVGAATPVSRVKAHLREHGQRLGCLDIGSAGSIGGLLAVRPGGGHRRPAHGSLRERLIALRFITGAGELHQCGGRVAKNVAGYDLPRLLLGSRGTLALSLQAGFQVIPWIDGESLVALGERDDLLGALRDLRACGIPWAALSLFNGVASAALFDSEPGLWALALGIEDESAARSQALESAEGLLKGRTRSLARYDPEAHERLWERLDRWPMERCKENPKLKWLRWHNSPARAGALMKDCSRDEPVVLRGLCGIVELLEEQDRELARGQVGKGGWLRSLRPWRPPLELAPMTVGLRELMAGVKRCFDPDGLLPFYGEAL